ncbi:MAG: hypothetical protein PWQ77_88 [Kosmotogales bacterium]|nr:hypothetical protein [Kosmotogales bacterium]
MTKKDRKIYLIKVPNKIEKFNSRFIKNYENALMEPCEEQIHNLRISIRELSEGLKISSVILKKDYYSICRRLKELLKVLGTLRDLHVEKEILNEKIVFNDDLNHKINKYELMVIKVLEEFDITIFKNEMNKILDDLKNAYKNLDLKKIEKNTKKFLCERYFDLINKTKNLNYNDIKSFHKARISFKKFRYSYESLKKYLSLSKTDLKRLKKIQDELGEINDIQNTLDYLLDFWNSKISKNSMQSLNIIKHRKIEQFLFKLEVEKTFFKKLIRKVNI